MTTTYHPSVHKFAIFVVCWTVLLLIAGALVTSNDAALSVPDWPLSYGTFTPPMVGGIRFEHSHRLIAGGLGLLSIALAVLVWKKEERRWLRWFSVIAVAGIAAQAVLGGEVVIKLLHYWLPVIHACFAQIVFAALLSIAVFTSRWWISDQPQVEDTGSPSIHTLAIANSAVIYFQVILGAGFRHKEIPVWPHMAGALVVLGMVIWLAAVLRRRFEKSAAISKTRILLHAILGTQLLLGLGAYWSRLTTADAPQPMPLMVTLTVLHTVVGAILFGVSILIVLLCYRLVPRKRELPATTQRPVAI
ncbi:MAG TPA: COX15/CtaA family protein [Candidatus Acidoferrum sp.]|jgi:cytochrome c oxidase assembly protein subunit 15|nr:COX15/CtaA family protein [Candidatus Acidoferrum sp.]